MDIDPSPVLSSSAISSSLGRIDGGIIINAEKPHPWLAGALQDFIDLLLEIARNNGFLLGRIVFWFESIVSGGDQLMDPSNEYLVVVATIQRLPGSLICVGTDQTPSPIEESVSAMISPASMIAWLTVQ